jgi:uncharacterized protein YgiM (DUF1202 family)
MKKVMRTRVTALVLTAILAATSFGTGFTGMATVYAAETMVVDITDGVLNVRSKPSTTSSIVGTLADGDTVSVTSTEDGWAKIEYYGTTAYVKAEYLTEETSGVVEMTEVTELSATGKVTGTPTLNVRSGAANTTEMLGVLNRGDAVTITGKTSNDWYRISYNGKKGYVNSIYIKLDTVEEEVAVSELSATGKVTGTPTLNVRSGAANTTEKLGVLNRGDAVTITGKTSNDWYRISYNGKTGYVNSVYIKLDTAQEKITVTELSATGKVTGTPTLNVRSGAANTTDKLGVLDRGDQVTITGKTSNNWYRISFSGKTGYVNSVYITLVEEEFKVTGMTATGKVTASDSVNVRKGPGTSYASIGSVLSGKTVNITGKTDNNWYRITYGSSVGYVSADYIKIESTGNTVDFTVKATNASGKIIRSTTLNVRSGPAASYELLGVLKIGDPVKITGKTSNNWYQISYDGKEAYINSIYVRLDTDFKVTEKDTKGIVSLNGLVIRSGPANVYDQVGTLQKNDEIVITGVCENGWYRILYNGGAAYVSDQYVSEKTDGFTVTETQATATVTGTATLNVRSGPATTYDVLGTLAKNDEVSITGLASTGWYQIKFGEKTGYVNGERLTLSTTFKVEDKDATATVKTSSKKVYYYAGPSILYENLGSLASGASIKITGVCGNGWYRFENNGKAAYIDGDALSVSDADYTVTELSATGTIVNTTTLNVRSAPYTTVSILGTLEVGDTVVITGKTSNNWYRINFGGQSGYVSTVRVKLNTSYTVEPMDEIGTVYVDDATPLNVRTGPATSYDRIGTLSNGTIVTITGIVNDSWYQIFYNSKVGYVYASYIVLSDDVTVSDLTADGKVVNTAKVNIRKGPDNTTEILKTVSSGTLLNITGKASNGWYRVVYDGVTGYVSNKYLEIVSGTTVNKTGWTTSELNVRSGPSTSYSLITTLSKDTEIKVLMKYGDFYKINYGSNNSIGYVSTTYVTFVKPGEGGDGQDGTKYAQAQALLKVAQGEIGYVEGANNYTKYGAWYGLPNEAWCAMFVSWCANEADIPTSIIPKMSWVPSMVSFYKGKNCYYARSSGYVPKPGDIIFFGSSSHVGIVESVTGTGSSATVNTIEGNTSDAVKRRSYSISSSYILGYGSVPYAY